MLLCVAFASLTLFAEASGPIFVYSALTITPHNVQTHVTHDPDSGLIRDFLKH